MVSIPCGTCGKPIFPSAVSCPHCGAANSADRKVLIKRFATVLGGLLGLGLLTLMCAPQTKILECTYSQDGGNGPQGESSLDVDPSSAMRERFSINSGTKEVVFPGSGEIKEVRVPYMQNGNIMTFADRLGGRLELNLKTGMLRNFVKTDGQGRDRLSGTALCTGL
ncbi:MAG: hypothetical protein ACK550_03465 [Synechococcaceae cyanobacterium]|jgi:hypothetical protein